MNPNRKNMNSQAARRYACDRCREQKLKCSRSQLEPGDNSACVRCLRLGATCATGSGRPLGRPPMNVYSSSSGISARVAAHDRRGPVLSRTARNPISTARAQHQNADEVHVWARAVNETGSVSPAGDAGHTSTATDFTTTKQHRASQLAILSPAQTQYETQSCAAGPSRHSDSPTAQVSNGVVDIVQRATSASTPSNGAEDSSSLGWYEYNDVNEIDSEDLVEIDFGDLTAIQDMNEPLGAQNPYQPTSDDAGDHFARGQHPIRSVEGDSTVFVISMLASLGPALAELKNQPWASWNPHSHMTQTAFFHGPDLIGNRDLDLWDKTLSVITRFAMIMQTMSTAPSTTLPMTLVLLSTYIQLAELIAIILERINCCLDEGQASKAGVPTVAAQHHVTRSTNVQITMMMQILECQLQAVERLMGLPDNCRVWSLGNVETGLLPQDKSSELVQAVMGEAREIFQSLKYNSERIQTILKCHNAS